MGTSHRFTDLDPGVEYTIELRSVSHSVQSEKVSEKKLTSMFDITQRKTVLKIGVKLLYFSALWYLQFKFYFKYNLFLTKPNGIHAVYLNDKLCVCPS